MAMQNLKNNNIKNKNEKTKQAKFKRKKDVFGKSLSRVGIFVLIILEIIAFVTVKTVFTIKQNNEQKAIEAEIKKLDKDIAQRTIDSRAKTQKIDNIGTLIATLPTSFDKTAVYMDIDRIIDLSGLTIDNDMKRTCNEVKNEEITKLFAGLGLSTSAPAQTLKANKINFRVVGKVDEIGAILKFITYLTDYEHENFYYISSMIYNEFRSNNIRSTCTIEIYTFHNDVNF